MTPWFRLTLVCCVLFLFLGLTQAVDWNYQPVVSSGSSFDPGTKATSDSPTSSAVGKHGLPSGSRWNFPISGPGLWIDWAQYWSTRPGEPPAPGTDGTLASCRSNRQLKATPSSNLVHEIVGFQPKN